MRSATLGLLVDWLETEYQNRLFRAIEEVAQKHNCHLVCFLGDVVGRPGERSSWRNFVFDLASPGQLDALVLLSSTLGNLVGPEEYARFAQRYRPMPMCSLGLALPGVPSVLVDNAPGMQALVLHLIDVHGLRRLAFIRGPERSEDAECRYAVFRQVLEQRGLEFDPELVTEGWFVRASGHQAIHTLLDERRVSFDGLVAANDAMALGAIEALAERGLRVPHDVAVVGFDDEESARFFAPPLTTVRQPLREQGLMAAEQALSAADGETPPAQTVLRAQLVVRQSCGCGRPTAPSVAEYQLLAAGPSLAETVRQHRQRIAQDLAQTMRSAGATFELVWGEQLLVALEAELAAPGRGPLLDTLHELLETVAALGGNVGAWHSVVSLLRHHARVAKDLDPVGYAQAEELWHEARVLVSSVSERAQARARLRLEQWLHHLREMSDELRASHSSRAMSSGLAAGLAELGLRSGYVVAFEPGAFPLSQARLVACFDTRSPHQIWEPGQLFAASELLPGGLRRLGRRVTYVLEPLFDRERPLGYALLELGELRGSMLEAIRRELSWALHPSTQRDTEPRGAVAELSSALVPESVSADGYRVATYSPAARPTLGDYCEVLATDSGCWVGVGEVMPEGADAAAIALMIRSALFALVSRSPAGSPRELLATLNLLLFENLSLRLGSPRQAALVLMRCDPSGRMVLAGSGSPLLVCRGRDGRPVALYPPGPRLGAVHDLGRSLEDIHCQLEPGDVLLAYTPRLERLLGTESGIGPAELGAELERIRSFPVDEIRDQLVSTLRGWLGVSTPDLSLVVLRHGWEPPISRRGP